MMAMLMIYDIQPKDVVIFNIEKFNLINDVYWQLYQFLISKGGKIINARDLDKSKRYLIKNAISVPKIIDSPYFIDTSQIRYLLHCKTREKTFDFLHLLMKRTFEIPEFLDSTKFSPEILRYATNVDPLSQTYTKFVTIIWRKKYPVTRKRQYRIMLNGIELLEKLQERVKDNVLVRLADTARIKFETQLGLLQKTDHLVGIHGAGISLCIFKEKKGFFHEVNCKEEFKGALSFCSLAGHEISQDIIKSEKIIDSYKSEWVKLDADEFADIVMKRMEESENNKNKRE